MKKKNHIIFFLLTACLLVLQCPSVALADEVAEDYKVFMMGSYAIEDGEYYLTNESGEITDTGANSENYNVYCELVNGERILHLKNATIKSGINENQGYAIQYMSYGPDDTEGIPLVLDLEGENSLEAAGMNSGNSVGIYVAGAPLMIRGTGKLDVSATAEASNVQAAFGIWVSQADLVMQSGTLHVSSGDAYSYTIGIMVEVGNIYFDKGTVYANVTKNGDTITGTMPTAEAGVSIGIYTAATSLADKGHIYSAYADVYAGGGNTTGVSGGIVSCGNLRITGGNVYGLTGTSSMEYAYGICATEELTVTGGNITAIGGTSTTGNSNGLAGAGDVIIGGDAKVKATGGTAAGNSYGLASDGTLSIGGNANVEANGGKANYGSFGIGVRGEALVEGNAYVEATGNKGAYAFGIGVEGAMSITGGIIYANAMEETNLSYGIGVGLENTNNNPGSEDYILTVKGITAVFANGYTKAVSTASGYEFAEDHVIFGGATKDNTEAITEDVISNYKYAKFGKGCTATFDGNGMEGTMDDVVAIYSETISLPACGYTNAGGKVFLAWDLEKTDTDKKTYDVGTEYTLTEDVTFYALYKVVPPTGDNAPVEFWMMLIALSGMVMIYGAKKMRAAK